MVKKMMKWLALSLLGLMLYLPVNAQVQEGDTLNFWSVSYIDWPPLWGSPQRQIQAVCKKVGDHCCVFVETTGTMPTQSSINQVVTAFDTHFYPTLTQKYGPVPDQYDHDSAVYILAINETNWAGYFDPGQQMSDSMVQATWGRRSSEHELIYVTSDYFYDAGEIVAHEFGHLLHWGKDHSVEPSSPGIYWETAFVDEGFSTFAADYLTGNIYQHNVYDGDAFFALNPDIPLIHFTDYDQANLFMTFMFEHYGEWDYISALIDNQLNGWKGVDSTLRMLGSTVTFEEAFEQYCIANYADDSTFQSGAYGYAHFRFPDCLSVDYNAGFPAVPVSNTLTTFGSDYITFNAASPKDCELVFQGDSLSRFRVAFVELTNSNTIRNVTSLIPDASGRVVYVADSLGEAYTKLLMVAMCTDTTMDTNDMVSYSYYVNTTASVPQNKMEQELRVHPNPAKDKLFIEMPLELKKGSSLEVLDTSGVLKASFIVDEKTESIDISQLPAGVYVIRLKVKETTYSTRFVCTH